MAPRRQGVEYEVEHQVTPDGTDRLLILHNDHAENFELAQAPLADPTAWTPVVRPTATTPGCSGWTRSPTTSWSTCARTG